ncbi:MAG: hypothetical protein ABIK89_01310 [Planctomycetota bacterium]
MPTSVPTPTPSELDILAALWQAVTDEGEVALRVSDIHPLVAARRARHGESEPSQVTISSQLRGLSAKGLVEAVVAGGSGGAGSKPVRTRGLLKATTRSPLTGYRPSYSPSEVLQGTFEALASAYPESQRSQALLDFAKAIQLPDETLKNLEKLLAAEPNRGP